MSSAGARVLVVDDTPANRYAVTRTLRGEGFEVIEAGFGKQALELARSERPELIVLDVNLPDMLGFDVAKELRASPDTASISILQLSATFTDAAAHAHGLGIGADAYLIHPFDPRVLVATARALVRLRAAERRMAESLELERSARLEADRAREVAEQAERALRASEHQRTRLLGELEGAIRARDEFLAIASHDLRNPLFTLRLQLELLATLSKHGPEALATANIPAKIEAACEQVKQLTGLFENLLDTSRIASGHLDVQRSRMDLAEVVRSVSDGMRDQFAARGCPLSVLADFPIVGDWDRLRIEQVMNNLLSNALKYGAGRPVSVSLDSTDTHARIVVRDNGVGIGAENLERIFKQFERVETSGAMKSFGLGLWIVHRVVDALGGRIRVESQLDQGSTFIVELPLSVGTAMSPA